MVCLTLVVTSLSWLISVVSGIAQVNAASNLQVTLVDTNDAVLNANAAKIKGVWHESNG